MRKKKENYLIDFAILPTAVKSTIRAKQMLETGRATSIYDAVRKVGISRSAFYKYKDHVAESVDENARDLLTMIVVLPNDMVVMARLLRKFAKEEIDPVTMEKTAPAGNVFALILSFYVADLPCGTDEFARLVRSVKGVEKVLVLGEE